MSLDVISIGSDNLVRLDALTNASTGAYVNNATVSFTLKDANGNVFQSQSNVTMSYVAASNGRYEGTLTSTVSALMNVGDTFTVEITATQGGVKLFRRLSCIAKYRSSQ